MPSGGWMRESAQVKSCELMRKSLDGDRHLGRVIITTYRFVTERWLRALQIFTLTATAIVGASIAVTPRHVDVKLSAIERFMEPDSWAISMIVLSTTALVIELWIQCNSRYRRAFQRRREAKRSSNDRRFIATVAWCHILLCGLMVGYGAAAMSGVISRAPWNFGAPTIALLVALLHLMFANRRPRA